MAIHRSVRLERLPKLSGSALRLLFFMFLHPRARASTRLRASAAQRLPRWSCLQTTTVAPCAVVIVIYIGSATPTQAAVVG